MNESPHPNLPQPTSLGDEVPTLLHFWPTLVIWVCYFWTTPLVNSTRTVPMSYLPEGITTRISLSLICIALSMVSLFYSARVL